MSKSKKCISSAALIVGVCGTLSMLCGHGCAHAPSNEWSSREFGDTKRAERPSATSNNQYSRLGFTPGSPGALGHPKPVSRHFSHFDCTGGTDLGSASLDDIRPREIKSQLPRSDELWIIQRPRVVSVISPDDTPRCGALLAAEIDGQKDVPLPLKHTDVHAAIAGYNATVDVTQQYHNPYDSKIEAVYVFPLPDNAAVSDFVMTIGDRRIRGIIREREEAEQIYADARAQGYVASLLTEERPNIFTQKVANIEPGKQIDVNIKYFNTLAYADGWYEFVFPMVVGPRFNPPGTTDGVGESARGQYGSSGQATEVQYLSPDERSGHDIALTVDIQAGVNIEKIDCRSHVIHTDRPTDDAALVTLSDNDRIPNKDLVLRYKVAGDQTKSALLTHHDQRGDFFTLMLYPPAELASLDRHPMEMIFVLDCSGSMSGRPIEQAKAAIEWALKHLGPDDTFQLINFSNNASQLGHDPLPATAKNIDKGLRYLKGLQSEGGTMMIEGIKAALDFRHDTRRLRFVAFLTDGFIGNEAEILGEVYRRLGDTRIFSFGVGSSPNRYLLDRLALLGKGAVAYLSLDDNGGDVMDDFFNRVSHPAMTDLSIDWGGLKVSDVYPARLPDLFVGRPIILTGRIAGEGAGELGKGAGELGKGAGELARPAAFANSGPSSRNDLRPTTIRIQGHAANRTEEITLPFDPTGTNDHPALAAVWARHKIADLANNELYANSDSESRELATSIKNVALDYGLISAYTAFIAVDALTRTAGAYGTTVHQAVPVPDGVRYETTVGE